MLLEPRCPFFVPFSASMWQLLAILSALHAVCGFSPLVQRGVTTLPRRQSLAMAKRPTTPTRSNSLRAADTEEDYRNPLTALLSNFLPSEKKEASVVDSIDWESNKKRRKTSLSKLASDLEKALRKREWFVTGNCDPSFFASDFKFQDPDVKVSGIEQYARGVNKLFDQKNSRGKIISCLPAVETVDKIRVVWRLEGRVNVGPRGLPIKAFIVTTDLRVNPSSGLVEFQEDFFSIPGWDILLSAAFPSLSLPFLAKPAPPV